MPTLEDLHASPWLRRLIVVVLLGGLVLLSYVVLRPFLVPVIWALILAYVTWPLFVRLRRLLRNQPTLASIIMTLLLATAFIVPVVWLASMLRSELTNAYEVLANFLARRPQLPESITNIPWFGEWLQQLIDRVSRDPSSLPAELGTLADQSLGEIRTVIGGVGRNLAKTFFALLTAFFMYRNGEQFARQVREVMHQLLGERVDGYIVAIGDTTRAVVYGIVLAALAQGVLAGLGLLDLRPAGAGAARRDHGADRTGALWRAAHLGECGRVAHHHRPHRRRRRSAAVGRTGRELGRQPDPPAGHRAMRRAFRSCWSCSAYSAASLRSVSSACSSGPVILAVLMAVWREYLGIPHPQPHVHRPPPSA